MPRGVPGPVEYYGDIGLTRELLASFDGDMRRKMSKRIAFWAKHVNKQIDGKTGLAELNAKMADRVREEAIKNYESSRISRGKGYRHGDEGEYRRFSNGAMLRTLKNPKLNSSDQNGVYLFNFETLDQGAVQWYRLNFGAKPRKKINAGPKKPMKFMGRDTGIRINMDRFGPSNAFGMPVGYWSSTKAAKTEGTVLKKGRSAFYPRALNPRPSKAVRRFGTRRDREQTTRGIRGTAFLDKALTTFNKEYPDRLEALARFWMESGLQGRKL